MDNDPRPHRVVGDGEAWIAGTTSGEVGVMANQRINRVLRRRPEIDEAEFELLQSRVVARLSKLDPEHSTGPGDADPDTDPTETTEADDAVAATHADPLATESRPSTSSPAAVMMPADASRDEAPPDADPSGEQANPIVRTRAKRAPRRAAVPVASPAPPKPVAVSPYCPYCALLLDPAPEVSRRCSRCRERIIVKRIDGRAVYLTEASVAVFDGERKRMASTGHWTRKRGRWLTMAAAAGAPADRLERLKATPLSEESVEAAHSLYTSTIDRSFRAAKRERRWEDASRIMREHARVLFKLAGSPIPPPEDSIRAHREAATAALHGVGEIAREAELVSAKCCDVCRADDGRTFRIAQELRVPRLPHASCPKGLCRCDWYLAVRDESAVRRHLRRRPRADTSATNRSG